MFGSGKDRHVGANLRDDGNSGHRICRQAGNCEKKIQRILVALGNRENFRLDISLVGLKLVDVLQALTQLECLLGANRAVNSHLDFLDRGFTAPVKERCDIKSLSGMFENEADDGTRGFTKHVSKHIIQLQVGNRKAIQWAAAAA